MAGFIRVATPQDAAGVLEIYAPAVRDTVISFELESPSLTEMEQRITKTLKTHPWLVYEIDGVVAGYAYATKEKERAAYQWNVTVSVYVHPQYYRQGIASKLYARLIEILQQQGFYNAYAGIALPNEASVTTHEKMGFRWLVTMPQTGYKLGGWHDVGWWLLSLQSKSANPNSPIPFEEFAEGLVLNEI